VPELTVLNEGAQIYKTTLKQVKL